MNNSNSILISKKILFNAYVLWSIFKHNNLSSSNDIISFLFISNQINPNINDELNYLFLEINKNIMLEVDCDLFFDNISLTSYTTNTILLHNLKIIYKNDNLLYVKYDDIIDASQSNSNFNNFKNNYNNSNDESIKSHIYNLLNSSLVSNIFVSNDINICDKIYKSIYSKNILK